MKNNLVFLALILFGVLFRLLPHSANLTPVTAITLFAFSFFPYKKAVFIPLAIMFASDIFLGFHSVMIWVYASLLLVGVVANLKNKITIPNIAGYSLLSSFVFFIVTNFGVWVTTNMYEKSLTGLIECYYMAIPFFRNALVGDLFFSVMIFGVVHLALKSREPVVSIVNK